MYVQSELEVHTVYQRLLKKQGEAYMHPMQHIPAYSVILHSFVQVLILKGFE